MEREWSPSRKRVVVDVDDDLGASRTLRRVTARNQVAERVAGELLAAATNLASVGVAVAMEERLDLGVERAVESSTGLWIDGEVPVTQPVAVPPSPQAALPSQPLDVAGTVGGVDLVDHRRQRAAEVGQRLSPGCCHQPLMGGLERSPARTGELAARTGDQIEVCSREPPVVERALQHRRVAQCLGPARGGRDVARRPATFGVEHRRGVLHRPGDRQRTSPRSQRGVEAIDARPRATRPFARSPECQRGERLDRETVERPVEHVQ